MNLQIKAWLYINKKTGEERVSVKPWKRDGDEKWPRSWEEKPLIVPDEINSNGSAVNEHN